MSKTTEKTEQNGGRKRLVEGTRTFIMAGLGAMMLAQDELTTFANRLVEKGEVTEEKGRQRFNEFVERRKKQSRKTSKRMESNLDKRMEEVLHRLSIPTRSEIKALNSKITRLTKKVDELNKA